MTMWRDVFAHAANPEIYLDADNVRSLLPGADDRPSSSASSLAGRLADLRADVASRAEAWRALLASRAGHDRSAIGRTIVEQTAPFAAAAGAALQSLSAPGVFEDVWHLRLMALLADDVGVGAAERSRHDGFRDLARAWGLTQVAGAPRELASQRQIRDGAFRLPAIVLAMSRRSDAFDLELIGLDLAWRTAGLPPAWRALADEDPRWRDLDMGRGRGAAIADGADLAREALDIVTAVGGGDASAGVERGVASFSALLAQSDDLLQAIARSIADPRLAMAILLQDRAREARVYHGTYKLEGRPLSDWFREAQEEPLALVDALGRSRLVRPDAPERSALIGGLIGEEGKMFRIFTSADVDLIRRWIASLAGGAASGLASVRLPAQVGLRYAYEAVRGGDLELGARPGDIRSAYHLLQGRALAPATRDFARAYCGFWLDRSRASVGKRPRSLPANWRPGELREWLLSSHDAHADAFQATEAASLPSREAVIRETLQLAPLTLIDGARLQGFTDLSIASSRVGAPLFQTYWDELGNGEWRINHPKIYRDVLAAMDIVLPPTGSRAFADDPRLEDRSFRLPVYWLCIGKHPVSLRAEVLGLNLAMELSGVGGSYRNAQRFLKHHGFPTAFVDLHNTIDNVSTGHSAWAADAIDAHMNATRDLVPVEETWARIRLGYESLSPSVQDPDELDFFAGWNVARGAPADGPLMTHRALGRREAA